MGTLCSDTTYEYIFWSSKVQLSNDFLVEFFFAICYLTWLCVDKFGANWRDAISSLRIQRKQDWKALNFKNIENNKIMYCLTTLEQYDNIIIWSTAQVEYKSYIMRYIAWTVQNRKKSFPLYTYIYLYFRNHECTQKLETERFEVKVLLEFKLLHYA